MPEGGERVREGVVNPAVPGSEPLPDLEPALRVLAGDLRALLGLSAVAFWRWDAERTLLCLVAEESDIALQVPESIARGGGFAGQAASRLERVIVSEAAWSADDGAWRAAGLQSGAAIPVLWEQDLLGVLAIADAAPALFPRQDAWRMVQMAARYAAALMNGERWQRAWADSDRKLSKEREQSLVVQAAIRALQDSADTRAHMQEIARAIEVLGWEQVVVALRDEAGALRVEIPAGRASSTEELAGLEAVLEQCLQEDFERNQAGGLTFVPVRDAASPQWQEGDRLFAPLRVRQRDPIGVLVVGAPVDGLRPGDERLRALNILASLLAYTVEHARLLSEASRSAEALAEQVDELSMIHRADRELSSNLDVDRVIKLTIDWALRRTGADSGIVALMTEDQRGLVPFVALGYVDPEIMGFTEQNPWPLDKSIMGEVAHTGKTVIMNQIDDERDAAPFSPSQTRAQLSVPLAMRGEILGVLTLASATSDAFSAHHASFLERLARRATVALDNARLLRQSEQLADDMAMLYSASRTITSTLDHDEVLRRIAQSMALALECSSALILGIKPESRQAQVMVSYKVATVKDAAEILPGTGWILDLLDYPAFRKAADERRPLILRRASLDPDSDDWAHLAAAKIYGAIVVPLIAQEELIGLAVLYEGRHDRQFSSGEVFKAEILATQASVAIRQAWLFGDVRELETIKSEMIRMASHDLRNPLNNLMGYLELVALTFRKEGATPAQEEYLDHIRQSANMMKTLIDDLLTLERIESQREGDWQSFDLCGLVSEVVDGARAAAALKDQSLELDCPMDTGPVFGNQMQLRQAISNLVDNAIKYTPEGGTIAVCLELHTDRFDFRVSDSGYGISPQRQARIFERFYRAREPETEHISGTGLGLSLVKTVIERHGGQVWFESTPGEGSTFGFWLPVPSTDTHL